MNDARDAQQLEDLSGSQLENVTGGRGDPFIPPPRERQIPPPTQKFENPLPTQKFENPLPKDEVKPSGHGHAVPWEDRGPGRDL